jgi:hypothetical protein
MTRGDVDTALSENVRNMEYFKKYDHDDELKNKIYKK